jgi:hypothetical protein
VLRPALTGGVTIEVMNLPSSPSAPSARRLRRTWLPAAIAVPVTGAFGLLALASLASAALTDVPPYPHTGWLSAGLYAQAALGVTATILVALGLARASGQRGTAALGWVVIALSVTSAVVSTVLGRPA